MLSFTLLIVPSINNFVVGNEVSSAMLIAREQMLVIHSQIFRPERALPKGVMLHESIMLVMEKEMKGISS